MVARLDSTATSTSSGSSPIRATSVPTAMVEVEATKAPSSGAGRQRGPVGLAHGPQVVEAEDAVDAQGLGPAGGLEGRVGLVAELGKGDADLHGPAPGPGVGHGRIGDRPAGRRSRGHAVDSTRAFSSRRAMDMIRLWARILMKPGSGHLHLHLEVVGDLGAHRRRRGRRRSGRPAWR